MGIRLRPRTKPDDTDAVQVGVARREPWLIPPRLRTLEEEGERHASWLELFFDVVFVVAITQLSHVLVVDHSPAGFLRFAGLFLPVFLAWQGYTFYADRFDTDDLLLRVAMFAGMLAIAAMAVLIPDVAHGSNSAGFAIAYVALRLFMLALYWRAWPAVPQARPLIRLYLSGYGASIAVWIISLAVDPPLRYALWGVALIWDLCLPPLSIILIPRRLPTSASHVPERWGLFTLLVLGESVVAVALATSGSDWRLNSAATAILGFVVVTGVWWLYFDRLANVTLRGSTLPVVMFYSYAHLPLLMGLAAMSAGINLAIERAGEDQLGMGAAVALLGGVALYIVSLTGTRTVAARKVIARRVVMKVIAFGVIAGVLVAQAVLPPVVVVAGLAAVLVTLVFVERTFFSMPAQAPL